MEDLRERWIKMLKEVKAHCESIPMTDGDDCGDCELSGVCMLESVCPIDWKIGE